jgi:hypothetical protein
MAQLPKTVLQLWEKTLEKKPVETPGKTPGKTLVNSAKGI